MADPQQDWFASNAPAAPAARTGGDWFASNAPTAAAATPKYSEDDYDDKGSSYFPGEPRKIDPATGRTLRHGMPGSFEGHPENVGEYAVATGGRAAEGAVDMSRGNIAMGLHKEVQAASNALAPMAPILAAGAPATMLRAVGGGVVGSKAAGAVADAAGASKDQKSVAEDAGNIVGGGAAATGALRAFLESPAKALLTRNKATLDDALDLIFSPKETLKNKLASMAKDAIAGPQQEGTAAGPVPSGEPAPAPYRLSGDQIQDATTVTPRRLIGPEKQLPAAPVEEPAAAPAAAPKTAQVLKDAGVTQAMKDAGVAAPSASIRAVRPGVTAQLTPRADIQFPPGLNGEDASLMQLTRYNINELRFMANKRGLPVTPKDTHAMLIDKIQGSLTPDEVNGFTAAAQASKAVPSKFPENNMMAQKLNDAATALQQAKGSPYEIASLRNAASTIQQYPKTLSEIDLANTKIKGIDKRIGQRIQDFLQEQKAVPSGDDQAAGAAAAGNGGLSMLEALRQSLIQRGIKPPY